MTRPRGHWLLLFALVAMWGSAFMFTGIAVRGFSPTALVTIRLIIAAVLLTALVALRRSSLAPRTPALPGADGQGGIRTRDGAINPILA